jgi:G:T-mismatch repair DNA endonuclease (very short patch repair protein)
MPRRRQNILTATQREEIGSRSQRVRRKTSYGFQDPFPDIEGTTPEKILYARLSLLRIPFEFQSKILVNIPELAILKDYRPDFVIPDLKLIIEVQGAYWHSKPAAVDEDAYKAALYQTMGYKVLAWWDFDIAYDIDALFASEPALYTLQGRGGRVIDLSRQVIRDDTKGIRTLNQKRKRPVAPRVSRKGLLKSKSYFSV